MISSAGEGRQKLKIEHFKSSSLFSSVFAGFFLRATRTQSEF